MTGNAQELTDVLDFLVGSLAENQEDSQDALFGEVYIQVSKKVPTNIHTLPNQI